MFWTLRHSIAERTDSAPARGTYGPAAANRSPIRGQPALFLAVSGRQDPPLTPCDGEIVHEPEYCQNPTLTCGAFLPIRVTEGRSRGTKLSPATRVLRVWKSGR